MKKIIIVASLLATPAFAQQANPQEQIERTIGSLFVTNTNLSAQVQNLQAQVADLQKRIKELEPKEQK